MLSIKDAATSAALAFYIEQTDKLVFEDHAKVLSLNKRPQDDDTYAYIKCRQLRSPREEEYVIYIRGFASYVESLRVDKVWLDLLKEFGAKAGRIDIDTVLQITAAHEVRHRLQMRDLVTLFNPENVRSTLIKFRFGYQPNYDHLEKKRAALEYDADIVTWVVLRKMYENEGSISDELLKLILLSSPHNLSSILEGGA